MTHALIKKNGDGMTIIPEPYPASVDEIAYSILDCYGYSLCENYTEPIVIFGQEYTPPQFEFSTREIENPYRQSEDDPETVTQRIATQVVS